MRGELICRSGTCAVAVRFIAEELDSGDMRRNALAERRITSSRFPVDDEPFARSPAPPADPDPASPAGDLGDPKIRDAARLSF